MYYFQGCYTNMETEEEVRRTIRVDGQFFKNEREVYVYAMGQAYDLAEFNEALDFVEFLAC